MLHHDCHEISNSRGYVFSDSTAGISFREPKERANHLLMH
jgi:hypothetical protein